VHPNRLWLWGLFIGFPVLLSQPISHTGSYAAINSTMRNVSVQKSASETCSFDCCSAALDLPLRIQDLTDRVCTNLFSLFSSEDVKCELHRHRYAQPVEALNYSK
jgi:hypothetical protein